jgi:hypothetical protein
MMLTQPQNTSVSRREIGHARLGITVDIDSITGFCSSLGIAKGGIRWNLMQMPVSDLQSGLHLTRRRVQFFDSYGHFHLVRKPVHEIPHYTLSRLIGFEDVSLYLLFPRLYREGQQSSRLLDDDFGCCLPFTSIMAAPNSSTTLLAIIMESTADCPGCGRPIPQGGCSLSCRALSTGSLYNQCFVRFLSHSIIFHDVL